MTFKHFYDKIQFSNMQLKNYLKDYSTYIGIVLVQVILIGAVLVLLNSGNKKEALTTYTAPTEEVSAPQAKPQVTGESTQRNLTVNINSAPQEELVLLPGIGDATALKIIEYREKNGPFKSIEDIKNVSGIGDKKFEAIKDSITIKN